jgi:DNA-binding CsgD family transcriptional regulator
VPARLLDLTPGQVRIAAKVAKGESTAAIASDLTITAGTINEQLRHCAQKFGVHGWPAVIHAGYVTGQLQRPQRAVVPEALSGAESVTWRMVAIGATSKYYAQRARISHSEALDRLRALRRRIKPSNDPHLVTLGWRCGVLDESLIGMASGITLRVPAHR